MRMMFAVLLLAACAPAPTPARATGDGVTVVSPIIGAGGSGGVQGQVAVLQAAQVISVVDGDTIHVLIAGERYTVRYIGMDTPETVDPRRPVGCFGAEASAENKRLVEGKTVGLEKDVSETDRFGRLLRYVYISDVMVNEALVRNGYAAATSYPPDVKYQERFLAAEREARDAGRGLWGACRN